MKLPVNIHQIPIINYHKISIRNDVGITTRHPADFKRDMQLLRQEGYQTVTFADLLSGDPLPEKPVIVTFDDGYRCVYQQALPVMQKLGQKGVVFIPTAYIGKENGWDVRIAGKTFAHCDERQLIELQQAGFEIGSHGRTHRALDLLSQEEMERELNQSKQELKILLGKEPVSICYPFGRFDLTIISAAKDAGYRFGAASLYFKMNLNGLSHFALRRFNIYRFESSERLRAKLRMNFNSWRGYRDWLIQQGAKATVFYQKRILKFYQQRN